MSQDHLPAQLPENHTVLFFAPFYNRSGYGSMARGMAWLWHQLGIRFRVMPVDEVEEGIDDCDMAWLKSMEQTPIVKPLAAVIFHVPNPAWLSLDLPKDCLRIIDTTFDSSAQGNLPPKPWIEVCKHLDQVWLQTEQERDIWIQAGLAPERIKILCVPHGWIKNPILPPAGFRRKGDQQVFRFLTIGMYQPRRRWDTLIEAFLSEFSGEPDVELYIKVNYPSWHPVPGRPKAELNEMLRILKGKISSKARVVLDDDLGTRRSICDLIDSCDFYASADTCTTAPMYESIIRGKRLVIPASLSHLYPEPCRFLITEDPNYSGPMTEAMLAYQPHHQGKPMPLLHVDDVRRALRLAYDMPRDIRRKSWDGWESAFGTADPVQRALGFKTVLAEGILEKLPAIHDLQVRWEGTQFVFHSLAHVNRRLCLGLIRAGVKVSLVPYEKDQFDGSRHSAYSLLADRVHVPLEGSASVHVRHQWPPHFDPPKEGAWVILQPWEYGGMPISWVAPMRDLVDEIWVPSTLVKEGYVASGVPESKVVVIPNGIDTAVFTPEGERYPLKTEKTFRFLFLGGTLFRKGIDILLNAYTRAFKGLDDVCLVIKGQSGDTYPGTDLASKLSEIRRDPDSPEIEYLTEALEEQDIAAVYRACDVFVLPYRGEGFGIPIAEAMACGLPVIVTERGASRDFVKPDWAYLIPSTPFGVANVDNQLPSPPGFWLEEPDETALIHWMRHAFEHPEECREKGQCGSAYARKQLGWDRPVQLVLDRLQVLSMQQPCRFLAANQEMPPPRREAFLYEPDWAGAEWVELMLSYFNAFTAGEPVALVFPMDPGQKGTLNLEAAQEAVLKLMRQMGRESFPDVMLVDKPEEWPEVLRGFSHLQWVPKGRGAVAGLQGQYGARLARARLAMVGTASKR